MVLEVEILREFTDGRSELGLMRNLACTDRQHDLVLVGLEPFRACCHFAEMKETANEVPKSAERLVVGASYVFHNEIISYYDIKLQVKCVKLNLFLLCHRKYL